MTDNRDLQGVATLELLRLYAGVLDELKRRGVTRSTNNPVADYTEKLGVDRLGFARTAKATPGHDAVDSSGLRYEIKARRVTPHNRSTQLSAIRDLSKRRFDFLIGVVFREDFSVDYAAIVPHEVVVELATFVEHTNSHRFLLRPAILEDSRVREITTELRAARA